MKLKDVCEQTGLTQKTVRFYEEKQLIFPTSTIKNGRSYREYSDADVKALREIAVLRKALFSIEEIYLMQQDPEEIETVVLNYAQRVTSMASTLKMLSDAVQNFNISELTDISELAQAMDSAAKGLPLPSYDVKPRFKYIDELEIAELERKNADKQKKQGDSPFILEQQKFTVRKGLFNEHYTHNYALTGGSANFPKQREAKVLRYVNSILSGMILLLTLAIAYFLLQRKVELVMLWKSVKSWLVPLDIGLLTIRLMTSRFYKVFSEYRKTYILNWKQLLKYCGILFSVFLLIVGGILLSGSGNETATEPDFTVVVACEENLSSEMVEELESLLQSMIADYNQDNRLIAAVHALNLTEQEDGEQFKEHIATGTCSLFLLDERSYQGVMQNIIQQSELEFVVLPEDMQSPFSPSVCDITTASFLSDVGLDDTIFYGLILCNTTHEEFAVEILSKLQDARIQLWY